MDEQQNPEPAETSEQPTATPADDLQKKCDEYLEGWKRAMADYANLKKENERGQTELAKYAAAGLVASLLPVLDGFTKAEAAKPARLAEAARHAQWSDGVSLVKAQFESVLKNAGVTAIDETGVPFDPSKHEAMIMEKRDKDHPAGEVIRVLESGYRLHDRVIRPAKVVVAE